MSFALLGALAGCGRIEFAPVGDAGSADSTADTFPDACPFSAWSAPVNLGSLNSASADWSPTLAEDGLEVIFQSGRGGNEDLYRATRPTLQDPFGAPVALGSLNSAVAETAPSLARDALTLYFASNRNGSDQLFRALRPSRTSDFGPPSLVPGLESIPLRGPAIAASGTELFVTDDTETSISRAVESGGTFAIVATLSELGAGASYPDISSDGRTLYFTVNQVDLAFAQRPFAGAPFGPVALLADLDTASTDSDADFGVSDQILVMSSTRPGGLGGPDLWITTRQCQ